MTWTDLTSNMTSYIGRLKTRFPHVEEDTLRAARDRSGLIDHVACKHHLTRLEAHQEIDDWLFVENLARRASELRAR